ncbi:hypothetical protein KI387_033035, partial [Taxus chinensis]
IGLDVDILCKRGVDEDEALCEVDGILSGKSYEVVDIVHDGDGNFEVAVLVRNNTVSHNLVLQALGKNGSVE